MPLFERLRDGVRRGGPLTLVVDGAPLQAFAGESVATALLADDRLAFRRTSKDGSPRGPFCAMGVCFECLVTIDGVSQSRACTVIVKAGMQVDTHLHAAAADIRNLPHDPL